MKIAYLIIAHDEPELLGRLVSRLNAPFADIFIHVDAKKDIEIFKKHIPSDVPVKFIAERIAVYRGGFSLTRSMIALLKDATQGDKYDYYQTLSGLDYPIKTNDEIWAKYKSSPDTNYLNHYELSPDARLSENIYNYHWVDMTERMPGRLKHYAARLRQLINKIFPDRKFLKGVTPHRGSQWFAITRETAQSVVKLLRTPEGKRIYNFFRFSWGSDEILFQTLILHLGFKKFERHLHYVDWEKSRENPAVLDMGDLDALKNSPELFTRKVRLIKSAELLNRIDEWIRK